MISRFGMQAALALLGMCCLASLAQAASDFSSILEQLVEQHELPGMVAVVVEGDAMTGMGVAGVRVMPPEDATGEVAAKNRLDINDPMHLGSDTKAMTATLVAQLIREDKLRWDSTLGELFPEMRDDMAPGVAGITVEQLLTHRSGLAANFPEDQLNAWRRYDDPLARQEGRAALVEQTVRQPLAAEPGLTFIYSNLGYTLAGAICERLTGKSWERLMTERIFEPLDMQTAGFGPPKAGDRTSLRHQPVPQGHSADGQPAGFGPNADNPQVIGPAGTVHASLPDWSKFAIAHLDAGESYPRLVPASYFEKLHTPAAGEPPKYACGWGIVEDMQWTDGPALYHVGSNTLWVAEIVIAPQRDAAILVATNMGGPEAEAACREAVAQIAALMFD